MITTLSRKQCLESYPQFPTSDREKGVWFSPKSLNSYILTSDFGDDLGMLAMTIWNWTRQMGLGALIFLGDADIPWLLRKNKKSEFEEGFKYFEGLINDKTFDGGFVVDEEDIGEFLKHLIWLTKTNMILPYVHFMDKGQGLIGSVCQYGNVHVNVLDENIDRGFLSSFEKSQLRLVPGGKC